MRQLKITKPIPNENISREELEKRQERFSHIIEQLAGGKWKDEETLKSELSIYLLEFCAKHYKFKPTEEQLFELISFCLRFSKKYDEKRFEKWFFICLMGQISLCLQEK